jgi:hypothetical protein
VSGAGALHRGGFGRGCGEGEFGVLIVCHESSIIEGFERGLKGCLGVENRVN